MIGNSGSNINWIPEPGTTAPATIVGASYPAPMAEGWLCPRCKRVNSPMMMQCNCPAQVASQPANTDNVFICRSRGAVVSKDLPITLT